MDNTSMPPFFLTPTAISTLTVVIFVGAIAVYLGHLARRTRRSGRDYRPSAYLSAAFGAISLYALLVVCEHVLYPDLGFYALPPQSVVMLLGLLFMVGFAAHFPKKYPANKWRIRLVQGYMLALLSWETGFAIYRYIQLAAGDLQYRPPEVDLFFAGAFPGIVQVLLWQLRQADPRPIPLWRKIWRPQGKDARATRDFALLAFAPLLLMGTVILQSESYLLISVAAIIESLGLLLLLLVFVLVYLNHHPDKTSFTIKLVAISLAFFLGVLGAVGEVVTPGFIAQYRNPDLIAVPQTLQFTPQPDGGYMITQAPYSFQEEMGERLFFTGDNKEIILPIGFAFPFYNEYWSTLTVTLNGGVIFDNISYLEDTLFRYGSNPSIFLLGVGVTVENMEAGVFVQANAQQMTITWKDVVVERAQEYRVTSQLRLFPDGVFEMAFAEIPTNQAFDIYERWYTARFIGALPGVKMAAPEYIRFNDELPLRTGSGGVMEDYHRDFRIALHEYLQPLFGLTLFSLFLVVIGLPLAIRRNLVIPIQNLLAGMQAVDAGDLTVSVPVKFNDEFGYLTQTFNQMTNDLRTLVTDLEGRVQERTVEVEHARKLLRTVIDNLDTLIYVSDMETHQVLFSNQRIADELGLVVGRHCWDVFQAGQTGQCSWCTNPLLLAKDGSPARPYQWEMQNTRNQKWYAMTDCAIHWDDGRLVRLSMAVDITEIKQNEANLRAQQRSIAVLEERERIGAELHDRLGQLFGFLNTQSQAVQALFAAQNIEVGQKALLRLAAVAQEAHGEVRGFILGIKGQGEQKGFWETLTTYVERFQSNYGIQVVLELPITRKRLLPSPQEVHLLRIIQEALSNARQHSGAKEVTVRIIEDEQQVCVTVADDGQGFDPDAISSPVSPFSRNLVIEELEALFDPRMDVGHFGLQGMREHAAAFNGTLEIDSHPGQGTRVRVTFTPFDQEEPPNQPWDVQSKMRVMLVDDHSVFLEGLRTLLEAYGVHIVGTAENGLEAQRLAQELRPDVIVMDIHMPICDGIEATRQIKQALPEIEIVMLTVSAEDQVLYEALKAGASGYLLKSMQAKEFFTLLTGLADGVPPFAPELAGKILDEFKTYLNPATNLSDQERSILGLVAQGKTYFQIGQELHVSDRTVRRYMKGIMERLHLRSRAEMERYARERGLGKP